MTLAITAYVRLTQPDTPTSAVTDSSYLRLGAPVSNETDLVTSLTTTTSSNSDKSVSAISQAKSDKGVSSSMGQKEEEVTSTVTGTYTTENGGVLLYTNYDFQTNVKGAMLTKIGNGQTTEVTAGDALYKVDAGTCTIHGENGVTITAGTQGDTGTPANITLEASDYINQTSHGPLCEISYGHTEKRSVGDAMEFFLGTKWTCMFGAETKLNLVTTISSLIGAAFKFNLSFEFSLNATGSITIKFFSTNALTIGSKLEIIAGNDFKQVTGDSTKIVVGPDVKLTTNDTKVVLVDDLKLAIVSDMKKVGVNGTVCEIDLKKVNVKLEKDEIDALTENMVVRMQQLVLDTGDLQAKSKSAVLHL